MPDCAAMCLARSDSDESTEQKKVIPLPLCTNLAKWGTVNRFAGGTEHHQVLINQVAFVKNSISYGERIVDAQRCFHRYLAQVARRIS